MSDTVYDVIFIGGGPGGYVGAIKAAQLGLKTACVEGRGALGGTCLNVGCIPSKALLHASHLLHDAEHNFAAMGLKAGPVTVDLPKMMTYKQGVIDANTKGIEFLFKKNKVDYVKGWASLKGPGAVAVKGADGAEKTLQAKNIVIATGSEVTPLKGVTIDEQRVVSSTGALTLTNIPKRLAVIGAGVIGLELGSVWGRMGAQVTVIEYLDAITPGMDGEIQKTFKQTLEKQGFRFVMGAAVTGVDAAGADLKVNYSLRKDDSAHSLDADVVLVAVGRRPYTAGLGLEAAGVKLDPRGRIETDGHGRTSALGVWAIGDVIAGPMLAHKAEEEGAAVAETIAGQKGHVNYDVIPGVIYTDPEVATVGKTEEQLKAEGRAYKVGKFSFMGNGRAKAMMAAGGFVKVLADAKTDRILGVHILGPQAGEMIHEFCVAMEFGASAEDLARTCHAHPTLSEAAREACMAAAFGQPIHS